MRYLILLIIMCSLNAHAATAALYNFSSSHIESAPAYEEVVPIASITKLFTAVTVINEGLDLNEKVKVQGKNKGHFPNGAMITRMELMKAMLIASDNKAADSLAYSHPGGYNAFINASNKYALEAGLKNTHLDDASGLLASNVSTSSDLLKFLGGLREYKLILQISSKEKEQIQFDNNKRKTVKLSIRNTNPDISKYNVLLSKTGFTSKAGRCLVMLIEYKNEVFGVAILGERTPRARSETIKSLIKRI